MKNYTIAFIVGSICKDSLNRRFARAVIRLAPEGFSFTEVQIADLPLYSQDDDASPAESVVRLKR